MAWLPIATVALAIGTLVWRLSAVLNELQRELAALRGQHHALSTEIDALRSLLLLALRPPSEGARP